MIPYGRHDISQDDIDAVVKVLKSDYLTQGESVPCFEDAVANKVTAAHAIATNSATSALHLACLSLDLGVGDYLWTVPNTFVASANCGLYCGAEIDFVDIDPVTHNISIEELTIKLDRAALNNTLPKIVIPVAFSGLSCEMEEIFNLSKEYGFKIVEDASHAIGGKYNSGMIGSCKYSDVSIFSFHPVKIITSGEGGMVLTNDIILANKIKKLRSHGITRDPNEMIGKVGGDWYYEQLSLGYNYRMSDIHAALGLSQLSRLDSFIDARNKIAQYYDKELKKLPLFLPKYTPDSAWHLYVVMLDEEKVTMDRGTFFDEMRKLGIGVNVHYIPVHTQPFYQSKGFRYGDFPVSESYYQNAISLPIFPFLTEQQQDKVVISLRNLLK